MKKHLTIAALISLIVLTIVLSLANRQMVVVNYLFGRFKLPLILVIVGAVLIGMAVQYLLTFAKVYGLKQDIKSLKKQLLAPQEPPVGLSDSNRNQGV